MKDSKDITIKVACPYCHNKVKSSIPYNCRPISVHKYDTLVSPLPSEVSPLPSEKTVECDRCRKNFHVVHSEGKDIWKYQHFLEKFIIGVADILKRETEWGKNKIIRRIWTTNDLRRFTVGLLFGFVLFFLWPNFVHFLFGYDYPRDYYIVLFVIGTSALILFYKIITDIKIHVGKIEENIRKGEEELKPEEEEIIFPFNKKKIESKPFDIANKTQKSISMVDLSFSIIFSGKWTLVFFSIAWLLTFAGNLDKGLLTFAWMGNYFLVAVASTLTIGFLYFLLMLPQYLSDEFFSLKTKIIKLSQVTTSLITLLVILVVVEVAGCLLLTNPEALQQGGVALQIALFSMPILMVFILFFTNRYAFKRIIETIHERPLEKLNKAFDELKIPNLEKIENQQSIQVLLGLYDRIDKSRSEYYTSLRNVNIFLVNLMISLLPIISLIVQSEFLTIV